jgi:hypothetical protein
MHFYLSNLLRNQGYNYFLIYNLLHHKKRMNKLHSNVIVSMVTLMSIRIVCYDVSARLVYVSPHAMKLHFVVAFEKF